MKKGSNRDIGEKGEEIAVKYLKKNKYKILERNYLTKLGEVDIIAKDKGILCFIEVKSRRSNLLGAPEEAISLKKKRQISKLALIYLKENNIRSYIKHSLL